MENSVWLRRLSDCVAYCSQCPWPAYHIGYEQNEQGKQERLFECAMGTHQFRESQNHIPDFLQLISYPI